MGSHKYTASTQSSTQHWHPSVHSSKPNQYTALVPKERVSQNSWIPISTQRQANQVHSTGHPSVHSIKPNQYTAVVPKEDVFEKTWAPTLFLGGGFSMEFNESFRFNAGIMYDVINATNSPFRRSYFIQKKTTDGTSAGFLPIIYRFAFFFPIS